MRHSRRTSSRSTSRGRRAPRTRTQALEVFRKLGVDASRLDERELKRAYRKLASQHHPDRPGNDRAEAQRVLVDLNGAYELLSGKAQEQDDFFGGYGGGHEDMGFGGGGRDPGFGGGPQMGGFAFGHAAAHEHNAAMAAQMHFLRHGPPNPAFGMPLVLGGDHMPRHPTEDALFPDPMAARPGRMGGSMITRSPGYIVLLVPPDIAPGFFRLGMGRGTARDWEQLKAWTDEQGLERLYNDMRAQHGPRLGRGRGPRGYLNQRGHRAGEAIDPQDEQEILKAIAQTLWTDYYAYQAENDEPGFSMARMGGQWDEVARKPPQSAHMAARRLWREIKELNKPFFGKNDLAAVLRRPDVRDELETFGHYLAMEALGYGVSWQDSHQPHGLKVPDFEYLDDMGLENYYLRKLREGQAARKSPSRVRGRANQHAGYGIRNKTFCDPPETKTWVVVRTDPDTGDERLLFSSDDQHKAYRFLDRMKKRVSR